MMNLAVQIFKAICWTLTGILLANALGLAHGSQVSEPLARPTSQQAAWQDLELGMFIHFAPNTWQDKEYDDLSTPLSAINPAKLDTDQWVDTAVKMGAKYIVFVAKHVGGFCMWQTATTAYSIKNTAYQNGKGDVVAALARSCRKRGLKLGIYLSPRDDKFGAGLGGRCKTAEAQKKYEALYRRQLTELLTRYGDMTELWCDGSLVFSVGDLIKRQAPRAMVFQGPNATIRWVGNEDGFAPYPAWNAVSVSDAQSGIATAVHGDAQGAVWLPNEVDVSLRRPNWFWSTTNDRNILSLDQLLEIYYRSVGRGAQLLLNVTPNRDGLIPAEDAKRLAEFGREMRRRFGKSLAEYPSKQRPFSANLPETRASNQTISIKLKGATRLDHAILMEEIAEGERVREYKLEGLSNGRWVLLGAGTAIGHKRIHPLAPQELEAVRLVITKSSGAPRIRSFALFATNVAPPATWDAPAQVWADDEVGRWKGETVALDLSKKITSVSPYRLRFVADSGAEFKIETAEVFIDEVRQASLLRPEKQRADALILTVSEMQHRIQLRCKISGAPSGTILLQKL